MALLNYCVSVKYGLSVREWKEDSLAGVTCTYTVLQRHVWEKSLIIPIKAKAITGTHLISKLFIINISYYFYMPNFTSIETGSTIMLIMHRTCDLSIAIFLLFIMCLACLQFDCGQNNYLSKTDLTQGKHWFREV